MRGMRGVAAITAVTTIGFVAGKGRSLGAAVTVRKALGKAGKNTISWDRKLGGKAAARGYYRLIVQAGAAMSSVMVRLR